MDLPTARIEQAFARAFVTAEVREPELSDALREFVSTLKERGMPPERVLIEVKQIVRRVRPADAELATTNDPTSATAIAEAISRLCIGEYFRAD